MNLWWYREPVMIQNRLRRYKDRLLWGILNVILEQNRKRILWKNWWNLNKVCHFLRNNNNKIKGKKWLKHIDTLMFLLTCFCKKIENHFSKKSPNFSIWNMLCIRSKDRWIFVIYLEIKAERQATVWNFPFCLLGTIFFCWIKLINVVQTFSTYERSQHMTKENT